MARRKVVANMPAREQLEVILTATAQVFEEYAKEIRKGIRAERRKRKPKPKGGASC